MKPLSIGISRGREYLMLQTKEKWKYSFFQQKKNKVRTCRIFKESYKCENNIRLNTFYIPFNFISVLSQLVDTLLNL